MSTNNRTDFFETHLAQCVYYVSKFRNVAEAASLVTKMDESISLCQAAIASGSLKSDMQAVVATLPEIVSRYEELPTQRKLDFHELKKADVSPIIRSGSRMD